MPTENIQLATKRAMDSTEKAPAPPSTFTFVADAKHTVIMILDKVDGTYINESKNAMERFVIQNFNKEKLVLTKDAIDKEHTILVFSGFTNIQAAEQFFLKVKKEAPVELSWLPASKYSFCPISDENLLVLKTNKDIAGYISWLKKNYPIKL